MKVATPQELGGMVRQWHETVSEQDLYGHRVQFKNAEGGLGLTLYHNAQGGFVMWPGESPMPVDEWLAAEEAAPVRERS